MKLQRQQLERLAPWAWRAASSSEPNTFHITVLLEDNSLVCSCKGYTNTKNCWHVTDAQWELMNEAGTETSNG